MLKINTLVKQLILYCLTLLSFSLYSQSAIGLKIMTVGIHPNPWEQDYAIFENSIINDGSLIMEPGYQLNFQKFVHLTILSIEIKQGIYSDAAAKMAGHFSFGLRWKFFHFGKSSFSISAAPVFAFRENWNKIPQYIDNDHYKDNGRYQLKLLFGSELEYNVYVGKRSDISFSLMYNNSFNTIALGLGYRFWINPYVAMNKGDCSSCGKRWNKGRMRKLWKRFWH